MKEFSKPLKVIFTELAVGLENDFHCCPQVQLVITLKGSWYAALVNRFYAAGVAESVGAVAGTNFACSVTRNLVIPYYLTSKELRACWCRMIKTSDGTEKTMVPGDVLFQV